MRRSFFALTSAVGLAAALAAPTAARAQETPYELNVHVGALKFDDADDTDTMAGARFMLQYPSGWAWGGNFDWVGADEDVTVYLYSFEIDYTFPTAGRTKFFVGGGAGAATVKFDDEGLLEDEDDSSTDALVPLVAGIKFLNQPVQPKWAIRGDVRDNIIFGEDDSSNNFEFSGGVSFFF